MEETNNKEMLMLKEEGMALQYSCMENLTQIEEPVGHSPGSQRVGPD